MRSQFAGFALTAAAIVAAGLLPPTSPAIANPVRANGSAGDSAGSSATIPLASAPRASAESTRDGRSAGPPAPPSRHVHRDAPFSMVGVTWRGQAPDRISVRDLGRGGRWSPWTATEPVGAPAGSKATARGRPKISGTEPVWTGTTRDVQVRATRDGHDVTGELDLVALSPANAPTPRAKSGPTARNGGMPPVVSRAQWGADEQNMAWPPEYSPTTRAVVLHHTAETNDYDCARSAEIVRGIYDYQSTTLGWGDVGYNAMVDKCGTVFEGRAGGLDRNTIGGHAGGFNNETFGIAMLGTHETVPPSPQTVDAISNMAAWKLNSVGVDPNGATDLVSSGGGTSKFPAGQSVRLPTVFGHRDVGNTVCPGDAGYAQLNPVRDRAGKLLNRQHQASPAR